MLFPANMPIANVALPQGNRCGAASAPSRYMDVRTRRVRNEIGTGGAGLQSDGPAIARDPRRTTLQRIYFRLAHR